MIDSLYSKYFQKSRSFLYPALGIKRSGEFSPSGTYIAIDGMIEPEDLKLVCTYKDINTQAFKRFEEEMLLSNPLFSQVLSVEGYKLYVFDFQIYADDWLQFLLGKYSKLSIVLKNFIKSYYGQSSLEYEHMDVYLNPENYFQLYAKLLNVDIQLLKSVGQLCDPYDEEKERLKIPIDILENSQKTA